MTITRERLMVLEDMEGERLDLFVAENLADLSRSLVQTLIKSGQILVDGQRVKASYRLGEGQAVEVELPVPQPVSIAAENLPLNIIYQDQDLAVIDKPKGMVVHPAHGNWEHTLVNALLFHIQDLSGINGELRPGIVHRLAKNDFAHKSLAEQIKVHSIRREYTALVHGLIKENLGTIDAPIGRSKLDRKKMAVIKDGRPAVSNYEVMRRFHNYTLVTVSLLTGRTHQIRVHFSYIKHAVVGDPLYGPAKKHFDLDSQALHAHRLGFIHPRSGEYMEFSSPLPPYFSAVLAQLEQTG